MHVSRKRMSRLVGAEKPPTKRVHHLSDTDDAEFTVRRSPNKTSRQGNSPRGLEVFDKQEWTGHKMGQA
jgi:hypothetical protein